MLKNFKNKLCPLLTLALTFGCGKKITESQSDSGKTVQNQNLTTSIEILKLVTIQGTKKLFTVPRNATFRVPSKLYMERGNGKGKSVSLTYSLDPHDSTIFEFKCIYSSTSQTDEIPLRNCTNDQGEDVGDLSRQDTPLYKDETIEMNLETKTTESLEIHAWHEVSWK